MCQMLKVDFLNTVVADKSDKLNEKFASVFFIFMLDDEKTNL